MRERMADHFRLLVDFLGHEVLVVALVDQHAGCRRRDDRPLDLFALRVVDFDALARHDRPVAVFEIADLIGERRKRDRIGAQIHLAFAVADRERRALARADHQVVLAGEDKGEREGAAQLLERRRHRFGRRLAVVHFFGDQMRDHFGVGLAAEFVAVLAELLAQLAEILDDAVVHDGHALGRMRVRVALARLAVGCPARMADADIAGQRLLRRAALPAPSACPARGGARACRGRASPRRRSHSRDIRGA